MKQIIMRCFISFISVLFIIGLPVGAYAANGWVQEGDKWYYINSTGGRTAGWVQSGGKWYYLKSDGSMATGWQLVKNAASGVSRWYYLEESGAMHMGWLQDSSSGTEKWYYFNGAGAMYTGWLNLKGGSYYFHPSGQMAKGWLKLGGLDYYFDSSGKMATGWVEDKSSGASQWYYMRANGAMATGWVKDAGKWFYLRDAGGAMMRNTSYALYSFGGNGALVAAYPAGKRNIDPSKPMLALTFDDGPSANTARILAALDANGARGTFFMVGNRVSAYPGAAAKVVAQGSEIGSHTWDHKDLTTLTQAEIRKQLVDTSNAIYSTTGVRPIALRPSYGKQNSNVAAICKEQGHIIVNWNVDTLDWKTLNADAVANEIVKSAKPGSIILCHDLYGSTAGGVEKAIPQLVAKGYQLVTVSELLTYGGMHPGSIYYHK